MAPKPTQRWVALLRGVNVGGNNKVPMTALAELFRGEGCADVETYIQSGNVVFSKQGTGAQLEASFERAFTKRFGFEVPFVVRSEPEVRRVVEQLPFEVDEASMKAVHVMFLKDTPRPAAVASLDSARSPPDRFLVQGAHIYLHYALGAGKTKLTNQYFDSRLKTVATARNWRTVLTLHQLLTGRSSVA